MSGTSGSTPSSSATKLSPNTQLRWRGVGLLVVLGVEGAIGGQLSLAGSPYPPVYLWTHIVLAILLIGFGAHALILARRLSRASATGSAVFTFACILGATIAGTVFLLAGQNNAAFYAMEGLFGVAIVGAILLILLGSVRSSPSVPASTA